ncbi:MAG TPA: GNAT family N-acetyltransferase [Candidatus Poseidoniaceae archaeon]|nr:MAG TPA: N-acetyltransferase [Candidatus Poseidoniales archaeon]HII11643.1 GNAT family N-acetyltransferase [Candidatus Poseidoniaceae archaeon]|tara:strand:- start:407 stop:979 length:573 start_codon:yes stop_codon:yes gene_type:complete
MTPELDLDKRLMLKPVSKSILPNLLEAYNEDPQAAQTALPWLDASSNVQGQLSDMLFDVESQAGADQLHFWWVCEQETNTFVGLIGLGDELQLVGSSYNLGYWVRPSYQRQGIALMSANRIFTWLEQRTIAEQAHHRIEITVHPHNTAGLATATRICQAWHGEIIEEFIGIEIGERTVPHRLHIIDLPRS